LRMAAIFSSQVGFGNWWIVRGVLAWVEAKKKDAVAARMLVRKAFMLQSTTARCKSGKKVIGRIGRWQSICCEAVYICP
jgi:hypothetical protein